MQFLQRIGKALMPSDRSTTAAGLLLRLGQPDVFDIPCYGTGRRSIF